MATKTANIHRIKDLSTPKSLPAGFLEERRSIYWENGIPEKDYSKTTSFALTSRQEQLVYSKRLHSEYQGDRPSPIWAVSPGARTATPSKRISDLSQSKRLHSDYHPCRQVMTVIPSSSLRVRPSERLHLLARHKTYPPRPIKHNSEWDWGEWETDVSAAAKTASASGRVMSLAVPKEPHSHYKQCRQVQWKVTKEAQSHMATERVHKLARPKNRNVDLEDYDPQAWNVSLAALNAKASPRIDELSTPLPRKVRTKK